LNFPGASHAGFGASPVEYFQAGKSFFGVAVVFSTGFLEDPFRKLGQFLEGSFSLAAAKFFGNGINVAKARRKIFICLNVGIS